MLHDPFSLCTRMFIWISVWFAQVNVTLQILLFANKPPNKLCRKMKLCMKMKNKHCMHKFVYRIFAIVNRYMYITFCLLLVLFTFAVFYYMVQIVHIHMCRCNSSVITVTMLCGVTRLYQTRLYFIFSSFPLTSALCSFTLVHSYIMRKMKCFILCLDQYFG